MYSNISLMDYINNYTDDILVYEKEWLTYMQPYKRQMYFSAATVNDFYNHPEVYNRLAKL